MTQVKKRIWLSPPHMGGNEEKYVKEAFDANWVAPAGPNLNRFEDCLSKYFGVSSSCALNSGTAGLHLALINAGVKQGDYVLCQSMTFIGSANPIMYLGAHPVFIDSEMDTYNMDPDLTRKAIEDIIKTKKKKPAAIIPVHLYGMPAKMAELEEISMEYDVPLIEDAAEAVGSKYLGKACGSFGRMSILSFNGNKVVTSSGGGALLSNDTYMVDRARFLSTQAKDNAPHYEHSKVGYNYRMSNISAGIGLGQMEVLDDRVRGRRAIFDAYKKEFENYEGIEFLLEPYGFYSNRWLTTILVHPEKTNGITREHIRLALDSKNIESRPLWKPLHMQPLFEGSIYYGNGVSESLFQKGLCLPSGTNMSDEDLKLIFKSIHEILNHSS